MSDDLSSEFVLVTGGAGFVGSKVVELLAGSGRNVRAVDVVENERSAALASLPGIEYAAVDLRDRAAVDRLLDGVSHVVHLAAVRSKSSDSNPRLSHEVNVDATYDLFAGAALARGSSHRLRVFSHRLRRVSTIRTASPSARPRPAGPAEVSACTPPRSSRRRHTSRRSWAPEVPEYLSLRFGTIYGPRVAEGSNNATMLDVLRALDAQADPVRALGPRLPARPGPRRRRRGLLCARTLVRAGQHGNQRRR